MAEKSTQKTSKKKPERTLKEKRSAKKAKNASKSDSSIPSTGR